MAAGRARAARAVASWRVMSVLRSCRWASAIGTRREGRWRGRATLGRVSGRGAREARADRGRSIRNREWREPGQNVAFVPRPFKEPGPSRSRPQALELPSLAPRPQTHPEDGTSFLTAASAPAFTDRDRLSERG